jgi:hypothetical protein
MLILTKIHKAKYIEDMFKNEYLHFRSLKSFRSDCKDLSGRLDPKELNTKNEQLKTLTIKIDDNKIINLNELNGFSGQFNEYLRDPKINCCSLHWMEIEPNEPPSTFNEKLLELGDKALIIYNWDSFFKILDKSIEEMGLEYSRRKVTYYDPKKFDGDLTLHHKDEKFKWQNEYRILISPTMDNCINVPLPGLSRISNIIETKEINNLRIEIIN